MSCIINLLFANMSLKIVSVILIVLYAALISSAENAEHSSSKFFVVSTTESPSECQIRNDQFTHVLQAVLKSLNESITNSLQKAKQEIIEETENKLQAKFSKMKQEMVDSVRAATLNESTKSLQKVKHEIIEETKNALDEKFSKLKQEIVDLKRASTLRILRDCKELQAKGYQDSGVYRIQPYLASDDFPVYCDMKTRGGGWTYAINRVDGSQNFYLNWTDYKNGFGDPSGEYWIGLENLYYLTNGKPSELLVEVVDWDSKKAYAHYSKFKIGNEAHGYKLAEIGEYSGDAGDSIKGYLGSKFSTLDHDQDTHSGNCAAEYKGAWWYTACFESHLTGRYVKNSNPVPFASGLHWKSFHGYHYSLKEARMMIRPLT